MGIGIGKHFSCRGVQGVNKDLFGKRILRVPPAAFRETSGLPKYLPVGCPVAGAGKPGRLDKGFRQEDRMPVDGQPVGRETLEIER